MKKCRKCNTVLILRCNWYISRKAKSDYICSECSKKDYRKYYQTNQEYQIKRSTAYREKNIERSRKNARIWAKRNPARKNASNAKRRAFKKQATPKWLSKFDLDYIRFLYITAKELEKLDGIKRHVDHIIPLKHHNLCGLHVPWNLQILEASENMKKSNKII